jgi:hypothetical protein
MFLAGLLLRVVYCKMFRRSTLEWVLAFGLLMQNSLKAIKDDVFPELKFALVIMLFLVAHFIPPVRLNPE